MPDGWTGPRVAAALQERGLVIATGYGKMKDDSFRLGHMGDHPVEELDALLEVLGEVFAP
jgi:aspartate aminotransferase-like enzyme